MNKNKLIFGIFSILLGIAMMFFEQTDEGAFLIIGFGLGLSQAALNSVHGGNTNERRTIK